MKNFKFSPLYLAILLSFFTFGILSGCVLPWNNPNRTSGSSNLSEGIKGDGCLKITADAIDGQEVGINDQLVGTTELAQSIKPSQDIKLDTITLKLKAIKSQGGDFGGAKIVLKIEGNSKNNLPDSDPLDTVEVKAADIAVDKVDSVSFRLSKVLELKANTTYWLRLDSTYDPSSSNFVQWMANNTDPLNDGLAISGAQSGIWMDLSRFKKDFLFEFKCIEEAKKN